MMKQQAGPTSSVYTGGQRYPYGSTRVPSPMTTSTTQGGTVMVFHPHAPSGLQVKGKWGLRYVECVIDTNTTFRDLLDRCRHQMGLPMEPMTAGSQSNINMFQAPAQSATNDRKKLWVIRNRDGRVLPFYHTVQQCIHQNAPRVFFIDEIEEATWRELQLSLPSGPSTLPVNLAPALPQPQRLPTIQAAPSTTRARNTINESRPGFTTPHPLRTSTQNPAFCQPRRAAPDAMSVTRPPMVARIDQGGDLPQPRTLNGFSQFAGPTTGLA